MPNSKKHLKQNFQTPISDESFYTPDRNTPKEEWKIIEVKTATKTTFTRFGLPYSMKTKHTTSSFFSERLPDPSVPRSY